MAAAEGEDACVERGGELEEACSAAKARGNAAYSAGDLSLAAERYLEALDLWEAALAALPQPKLLKVGELVRYDAKNYFGVVMSAFTMFDEYFLKDLGSDKAIWVGEAGGDLRRFGRKELQPVTQALLDLRLAVAQNLAAVRLKQEEWTEAVRWTDAALVISGRSPKALMRKGAALLRLNQAGPASDALATAAEVAPADGEVQRLLREAEARRAPNWVCVTGCCGPWGIVCGGPAASTATQAQVVAPAKRQSIADADLAQQGKQAPEPQIPEPGPMDTVAQLASSTVDNAAVGASASSRQPDRTPSKGDPSGPTAPATSSKPPARTQVDMISRQVENEREDAAEGGPPEAERRRPEGRCPEKAAGLGPLVSGARRLWMGTASMLLAAVAAAWMMGEAGHAAA